MNLDRSGIDMNSDLNSIDRHILGLEELSRRLLIRGSLKNRRHREKV